jgi:hypothetical protein
MDLPLRLAALLLMLGPVSARAAELGDILTRNAMAHGGVEAQQRVANVRYRLHIREPAFEVRGTYVATREGEMRIDVEADGQRVFSEGLDKGKAWQWTPTGGVTQQDEAGAATLRHGIEFPGRFFTLPEVRERGAVISLLGEVMDRGQPQWELRVTLQDGASRNYFIDQQSGLTARTRDRRAFHPGVDPTLVTIETRYSDPTRIDGLLLYRRSDNVNLDSGEWLGTTEVLGVEHNVELPDDYFASDR